MDDIRNTARDIIDRDTDEPASRDSKQEHGGIQTGKPQQPAPKESHTLPDTGDANSPTADRPADDLVREARDGFLDRTPPRGSTEQ